MGLGILEDRYLENVPGTSLFYDDPNAAALNIYGGVNVSKLKHGQGKLEHVVLVPQPSDDPNDPLNWPQWRKHTVLFILTYGTLLCGILGPLVTADIENIKSELGRSVQAISRALSSTIALSVGLASIWWSAVSVKIGKRPVFLFCSLCMFTGAMTAGFTKNYSMLVGARVLQGIGRAAFEVLAGPIIADIYFTHERGVPVTLWNLSYISGINVGPAITSPIIAKLDWRWTFRIYGIACASVFFLQLFLMPETGYNRHAMNEAKNRAEISSEDLEKKDDGALSQVAILDSPPAQVSTLPITARRSDFFERLAIFNRGTILAGTRERSFWYLLISPFLAYLTPVCFWASLLYGFAATWLTLIATSVAQIFEMRPYFFTAEKVGLSYLSPFICAMVAACFCGPLADYAARRMSKANRGVFEPEYRLVLVAFYAFFSGLGFFGWGISAHDKDTWIVPVIFFGVAVSGIIFGTSAAIGYAVDSHRSARNSTIGGIVFFKNILTFATSFFVNDWLASRGILNVFSVVAGIALFTSLSTIPMYIYGKRARSWIHRMDNSVKD